VAVLFNDKVSVEQVAFNSCNLEFVTVSGELHVVTREAPGGGTTTHVNGELKGVGSLGNRYVLSVQADVDESGDAVSSTTREVLVSKGSAPNQVQTTTFSFPPLTFDVDIDCRSG
jgi:hypothetical protein